jgi:hypothetical protein
VLVTGDETWDRAVRQASAKIDYWKTSDQKQRWH